MRKNQVSPPALHGGRAGALRERIGVIGPVDAVRRAGFAGQIRRGGARDDVDPVLLAGELLDRERDRRVAEAGDHVHLVHVVPVPARGGGDIRLVLMIGEDDLDRFAQYFAAEILDRHADRRDAARPSEVGIDARHVVEHRDLDRVIGNLGLGRAGEERQDGRTEHERLHSPPPIGLCLLRRRNEPAPLRILPAGYCSAGGAPASTAGESHLGEYCVARSLKLDSEGAFLFGEGPDGQLDLDFAPGP